VVVGSGGDGGGQRRLLDAPAAAAAASASAAASAAAAVLMVVAAVTVSAASASWCCHLCFSFVLVGSEVLLLLTRAPIARRDLTAPQAGPASLYHRNLPSSSRNGPFCARIAQLQGLFSPCGAICPCWPAASCLVRRPGWGGPPAWASLVHCLRPEITQVYDYTYGIDCIHAWLCSVRVAAAAARCLLLLALAGRAGQFHAARVDSQCSGRRSLY
jgi:hypothetical protein